MNTETAQQEMYQAAIMGLRRGAIKKQIEHLAIEAVSPYTSPDDLLMECASGSALTSAMNGGYVRPRWDMRPIHHLEALNAMIAYVNNTAPATVIYMEKHKCSLVAALEAQDTPAPLYPDLAPTMKERFREKVRFIVDKRSKPR